MYVGVEECDDGNMVDDDFCTNSCVTNGGLNWNAMFTGNQTTCGGPTQTIEVICG